MHMVQHLVLTLVMPPLFLLATPTWLARAVVGEGAFAAWLRRFAKPVVAGLLFNATVALTHWPTIVNTSVEIGPFHYVVHLVVVTTAFLMWMPVCGPIPEWRISQPAQMVYLFVMSILPTVPAGWLTFADRAVYDAYDHSQRLWGISVVDDQQMAGLVMKTAGGLYLWGVIASIFFRWAAQHERTEREEMLGRPAPSQLIDGVPQGHPEADGTDAAPALTWDQVRSELDRLGPAPRDPADH
jgi:putative membrane protein